jgi:hypothetical protein
MRTTIYIPFLILLLTASFSTGTFSQSMQAKMKKLSENSDLIVEGKVVQKKSNWNENKTRIYTDVTLQVDEYLKGNQGNKTIVVTTPGGEVDEVGELYTHMPRFENDENVLVFVKENKKSKNYKVLNGEEGKMTLYNDKITGEKVTPSNMKMSKLKEEIKDYVNKQPQK